MIDRNDIPVADAVRVLIPNKAWDHLVILSCPYCGEHHYHGTPEGHRVSHCGIPDKDDEGYFLHDIFPGRVFSSVEEAEAELTEALLALGPCRAELRQAHFQDTLA